MYNAKQTASYDKKGVKKSRSVLVSSWKGHKRQRRWTVQKHVEKFSTQSILRGSGQKVEWCKTKECLKCRVVKINDVGNFVNLFAYKIRKKLQECAMWLWLPDTLVGSRIVKSPKILIDHTYKFGEDCIRRGA